VKFYTDWGKPEKAAEWQSKLNALQESPDDPAKPKK